MHPLADFDPIPLPPFSAVSSGTMPHNPVPPQHLTADRPHIALPSVGQTRCYWTLLTSDLTFLYLDPVLQTHLAEQADLLIGKSLLAYVHPDEQASAKVDLGAVLESRTLHGSVTRVRYSRLSRVRRLLGYSGPAPDWEDADKVTLDAHYMAVDLVINYAADGLVLCFMHAVVDLTPRDNDEHHKTCWTNWCGTPDMSMDQVQLLYSRLHSTLHPPQNTSRVFQILLNLPHRQLCLSWPPERPGEPTSKDFARLAEDVQISSSGTDAKTSCTRRYKACQVMDFSMGDKREVESIFIPHGRVIFSCHKISEHLRNAFVGGNGMPHLDYNSNTYAPQGNAQYYDSHPQSLAQNPHVSSLHSYNYSPPPHPPMSSSYPPNPWVNMEASNTPNQYAQWAPSSFPSGAPISSMRSSSYTAPPAPTPQHHWSSQQTAYLDTDSPVSPVGPSAPSPVDPTYPTSAPLKQEEPPSPSGDQVPAPRSGRRNNREQYGSGGRTTGNPPVGVTRCASCKATHSPEWRKGPTGKKELCNACGLRFARSRAKKEGNTQRRRKDRAMSTLSTKTEPSPSSASPVSASFPIRRGSYFEDSSFLSTSSAGSGSGNDSFSHGTGFDGMTPSPSPPSGGMHYVPSQSTSYNPPLQAEGRSPFGGPSNQYYSLPPVQSSLAQAGVSPFTSNRHALPTRLDPVGPFPQRMSPMMSPSSPVSNSPMSAGLSAASYERDKRQERESEHLMLQAPLGPEQSYRMDRSSGYMTRDAPF
ncbi:hypothetical protein C8Q80DRAFT_1101876 [Daedaleopsis nitida]|nr:hypothetical protein C8Q80DRAFT_1101876 [Daedaleopsis nitida]